MSNIKKIKISKKTIEEAVAGNKRYYLWDSEIPGFGLCVQKTGYKSYFLDYKNSSGIARRMKLAVVGEITPDEARRKAAKLRLEISQGNDPIEEKQQHKQEPFFVDICPEYIEKHAIPFKKPASVAGDNEMIRNHLEPFFGKMKISAINRSHVKQFHYSLQHKKYTANRCVQLLSKIMNLCEEWGYRTDGSNPCKGIKKYKEEARERFLNLNEISRLQRALDRFLENDESPHFVALIRLLLFTGARLSEILECKWEYIDFDHKMIELSDSKTGKKNIIICERCIDILKALPREARNPYVIISEKKQGYHLSKPKKAWARLTKSANLEGLRIHDLRHTNASVALMEKVPLEVIRKRLGHKSIHTTMRYAHLADDQLRIAADTVSDKLGSAMGF